MMAVSMTPVLNALDAPTLFGVVAVFHALFCGVWLLLARVWRMAPRASHAMAVGQLLSTLNALLLASLPARVGAWHEFAVQATALVAVSLVVLALRRATRQRRNRLAWAWVGGGGLLAVLLASLAGLDGLARSLAGFSMVAQAGWGLWGLRRATRPDEPVWIVALLGLSLAGFVGMGLLRGLTPWLDPRWEALFVAQGAPTSLLALSQWLLMALAGVGLINLLVWRLVSRARNLLRRDSLTGALNRRAFQAELVEAQALLKRGMGFALVVMDVDHFKRVNDSVGHAGGDAALRHCVRLWRDCLRDLDQLGRLGGEEFGVILWDADLATATLVAERMRERLNQTPLIWSGKTLTLSASFGVALPRAHDAEGEIGLARADAQLYRAKAQGRNQVCVAAEAA